MAPRHLRLLALFVVLSVAPSTGGAGEGDALAKVRALFDSGMTHYNLTEYREALSDFTAAYRLKHDPVFLFNIAQSYRQLGEPSRAAQFYRNYLRESKDPSHRAEVEKFIADADAAVAALNPSRPPTSVQPPKTESPPATSTSTVAAKTEPAKTEPAKTEPAKTEPAKTTAAKTEPAKTEPAKTEPAKTEPAKTTATKTEPAKTEPAKAEPAKAIKSEPTKTEPVKPRTAAAEKPAAEKRRTLSEQVVVEDSDSRIEAANQEMRAGNYSKALDLVRRGDMAKDPRAWRVIGAAACFLPDRELVKTALGKLSPVDRKFVVESCERSHLQLDPPRAAAVTPKPAAPAPKADAAAKQAEPATTASAPAKKVEPATTASAAARSDPADADTLLARADDCFSRGDYPGAVAAALGAIGKANDPRAWRLFGAAACYLQHPDDARKAMSHISPVDRKFVKESCGKNQVVIP